MEHIKLALLKPVFCPPKSPLPNFPGHPGILRVTRPVTELPLLLESGGIHEVWSLDFETKGDYSETGSYPVGVGLASSRGSVYIDITESHPDTLRVLAENFVKQNIRLIAHNLFFDAGWFMRDLSQSFTYRSGLGSKEPGCWLNWHACTYALYRLLASEGYPGQQYGLKKAQVDLLGWASSNETGLDCWLIENEHVGNVSKVSKEGYYFYPDYSLGARIYSSTPPDVLGEHDRFVSPRKDAMHLAPPDILGTYCRLDAVSTLDLYSQVLEPVMAHFEGLQWYMHELYMRFIYLLVWQKISGITVNQEALDAHRASLEQKIADTKQEFLGHPDIKPHVAAYNEAIVGEHLAKEPKRTKGQWPPGAPVQYKKDGTETAAWQTYQAKLAKGPETSLNWLKWNERLSELKAENHFNLNSGAQKAWLFYERLGFPIRATTESGQPATDEVALRQFGEPGRLLSEYVSAEKELGFNVSLRGVMSPSTEKYHPSFRVPGTHTGRLAGAGGWNAQNPPKSLDFLRAFTVPEGYAIVTCDHASLEDYVLAELSRDASLWDFYATGKKGNCMYLSVGSRLPILGQHIRKAGYDPDNWTPESVRVTKKVASKWRQISKGITLASNYGAGPKKIHASLSEAGIDVSLDEIYKMHKGFWELRKGVKVWEQELKRQWKDNEGWLLNGFGRPICLEPMREKDLISATCQATGHDAHVLFQILTAEALTEKGLDWHPWHMDLHDCLMFAVRKEEATLAVDLLKDKVYPLLNHMLGGEISLKGEPNVCRSWADDKDEEFNWKTNEEFQTWLGPQKRD